MGHRPRQFRHGFRHSAFNVKRLSVYYVHWINFEMLPPNLLTRGNFCFNLPRAVFSTHQSEMSFNYAIGSDRFACQSIPHTQRRNDNSSYESFILISLCTSVFSYGQDVLRDLFDRYWKICSGSISMDQKRPSRFGQLCVRWNKTKPKASMLLQWWRN